MRYMAKSKVKIGTILLYVILIALTILFLAPIFMVLMNSFKGKLYISSEPFKLPTSVTFVGLNNYIGGITKTNFLTSFGYSLFITIASTAVIISVSYTHLPSTV